LSTSLRPGGWSGLYEGAHYSGGSEPRQIHPEAYRRTKNVEKAAARVAEHSNKLIACLAVEEVEVWLLAVHRENLNAGWLEVRAECDPKERFAEPLLNMLGRDSPGRGRKGAMRGLGAKWKGLLELCPEIKALKTSIASRIAAG
jgi:hypothetical protein